MPQKFALVARVKEIKGILRKTAEELTREEREHIFEFLSIVEFEKYRASSVPYFHLLGRYIMFEYPHNTAAEKAVSNFELMHEMLEHFAEGAVDLPANLLPEFDLYLDGWEHLAKCYEHIAERVEKHHEELAS